MNSNSAEMEPFKNQPKSPKQTKTVRDELDYVSGNQNTQIQSDQKIPPKRNISPSFGGQQSKGGRNTQANQQIILKNQSGFLETVKEDPKQPEQVQPEKTSAQKMEAIKNEEVPAANVKNVAMREITKPKKKKIPAKDDSGCDINLRLKGKKRGDEREPRLQLLNEEKGASNLREQRSPIKNENEIKKTKRKQLSVSQKRTKEEQKGRDLFPETEPEEFDLAQSLLTLQIYSHNTKAVRKDSTFLAHQQRNATDNLKGMNNIEKNIHQENIAKRVQEYAFGSQMINNEDISDIAVGNQQENADQEEEDNEGSHLKSVSLDDSELQGLRKIEMKMTQSQNGINDKIQNIIAVAEEDGDVVDSQPLPNEMEYESLGFGQSIWSTDIPTESKKQFIEAIKKQNTENNDNGEGSSNIQRTHSKSEQEKEFDLIQKTIEQETQIQDQKQYQMEGNNKNFNMQNTESMEYYHALNQLNHPMNSIENQQQSSSIGMNMPFQNHEQNQNQIDYQINNQYQEQNQVQQEQYFNIPPNEQTYSSTQQQDQAYVNQSDPNYQNYYQQQNQIYPQQVIQAALSVHSGGRLALNALPAEANYENEYIDNTSSNYTRHPLSTIGGQQTQNFNLQYNAQNQNMLNNASNRAQHLFINRQINKFMMNPIYKSKQTLNSISMHKYAGIPWRGQANAHNNINSSIQNQFNNRDQQFLAHENLPAQDQAQAAGGGNNNGLDYQAQMQLDTQYQQINSGGVINNSQTQGDYGQSNQISTQQEQNQMQKDSQPFYPSNYAKQEQNILIGGQNNLKRQRVTPAIHVPIPIPIINRQAQQKGKPQLNKNLQQAQNENQNKPIQNDRSIFMNEYFDVKEIQSKKIELDIKMKQTAQNLEGQLNKAVENNDDDEDDNDDDEEAEITFDVISGQDPSELSIERPDSSLNKSITVRELKNNQNLSIERINFHNLRPVQRERKNSEVNDVVENKEDYKQKDKEEKKEEKKQLKSQKQEIYLKLQKQLAQFKSEMFLNENQPSGHNSSLSPKRSSTNDLIGTQNTPDENKLDTRITPFKQKEKVGQQNAQQYLDRVLNLMTMINEIENLNNQAQAELKNKIQIQKNSLHKARDERDELINQFKQQQQRHLREVNLYKTKLNEINNNLVQRDEINQSLQKQNEYSGIQIFELSQKIQLLQQENQELQNRNGQYQEELQQKQYVINLNEDEKQNLQNTIYSLSNQINNQNQQQESQQMNLQQLNQENQKLAENLETLTQQMANKKEKEQDKADSIGSELTIEEQLENANNSIKDLQEYIKKKGLEDIKNKQLAQERYQQSERQHYEKYNKLKSDLETMEKEKDKIIEHLTQMITQNDSPSKKDQMPTIEQSTIEAQSFDSTFEEEKKENYDLLKSIQCKGCKTKSNTIEQQEQRIKQLTEKSLNSSGTQTHTVQAFTSPNQSLSLSQLQPNVKKENPSPNTSQGSGLKASQQILLNNYIRQIKQFIDNNDDQESKEANKMKTKLSEIAEKQRITLFDEEEEPDTSIITQDLIQQIMSISLEIVCDLLDEASQQELQLPKVVFQTVQFGISIQQLKEMQTQARSERKACHHIIVELEKMMYDMNSILDQAQINPDQSKEQFSQILSTYLQLPHRLKPIFDHSKKIENALIKSLKSQEEILKGQEI